MSAKYRVMIIDDEQSARNLLKGSINWDSLDMGVVGEAASGIEAINVIDELHPDIVFVDISMPFMDGIEFTEVATARYPHLVIIIMTAIDKFEYARKCVSLPVFEYMLKPMVRSEITEVLVKVKKRLDTTGGAQSDFGKSDEDDYPGQEPSSMEQIKRYIEANYTDSKLNLAFAAQQFGFSASYLSRRFKQDTGKNFVEYLTECRMKKAIQLAEHGTKMFRTSAEVGIPDPNYFGRCFKKHTGMSYSDYVSEHEIKA
ncbi:MAG: response regulator [Lachnospiraceae bacterium]|nr:response regulator [Lachnospiraceae bacterium]